MSDTRRKNPAVLVWNIIHNVAMWSGGLLWAHGYPWWAIAMGIFGVWALAWMVGLMRAPGDQQKGLGS